YGTALDGGSDNGTVFALNTNGTGFRTLYSFTPSPRPGTNSDGRGPFAGLVLSGNTLYGTASFGGMWGDCRVLALHTDRSGFTTLHNLAGGDGSSPYARLLLSGNTLYGTAVNSGISGGEGTVFSLSFRPQLAIVPSGTNVILTWPTNVAGFDYTGYALQSTTN